MHLDFQVATTVIALLAILLFLLGLWQQKIAAVQREEALADIYVAREQGTHRAIAQFPQIDEQACIGCGSCIAACPEEGVLGLVDGVARVIHGSRCIGHALCEEACPIQAITVGLGEDAASRADIPQLDETLQTSVPGMYIAGELGGLALIRIATQQGIDAVDAIADDLAEFPSEAADDRFFDLLIVGIGPAGIAASLRATELGLSYVAIDQEDVGGTVRKYPRRKLTLTGPMSLPLHGPVEREEFLKEELIEFWEQIIARHQLNLRTGWKLESMAGECGAFLARTTAGSIYARRVLLALGRRGTPRKLGVKGEESEKVLYQLIDAATYEDQRVLVVGGGDSAIEAATALADQPGNVVTLAYRREHFFRLKARNRERIERYARNKIQVLFQSNLQQVDDDAVTLTCIEDGEETYRVLANDFVFIFAGGEPPEQLLRGMGVRFGGEAEPRPESAEELVAP